MKLPYFLSYCARTPWAMEPAAMSMYAAVLVRHFFGKEGGSALGADIGSAPAAVSAAPQAAVSGGASHHGGVAVVNVMGPIEQRAVRMGPYECGAGCEQIGASIDAALADASVGSIIMQFDTPGGSVFGVQELGDKIRAARKKKPVYGIANSQAASAGYWLLAQCGEAYITPGGMAGSVGVYTGFECIQKAMEAAGISFEFISAGKYKVEGNPFEPLSDEARAHIQSQVDAYYGMFTQAVSRGRNVPVDQVRNGMGQGRVLLADDAVKAGMVDGVMTFEELIRKAKTASQPQRTARAAAMARVQADIAALS